MKKVVVGILFLCTWLLISIVGVEGQEEKESKGEPKSESKNEPKRVVEITANKLNIRNGIGTSFTTLYTAKKDDKLVVVNKKLDWLEVVLPPTTPCWVLKKFVETKGENKGVIKSNRVNIRSNTGVSESNVICQINMNEEVMILGEENNWYKIAPLPYFTGWVNEKYTKYWGDFDKYKVWAAEEEAKILATSKKEVDLKELFKKSEEVLATEQSKPYLEQNLEEIYDNYKKIAKESADKKIVATSKDRIRFLEPKVLTLKEFHQVMEELKKKYNTANSEREEAINKLMKEFELRLRPLINYVATGTIDYVGKMINRPGTHRLVKGGDTIYFLKSPNNAVDLDKFFSKLVGVKGTVVENKGWTEKTIIIENENDIKILAEEGSGE